MLQLQAPLASILGTNGRWFDLNVIYVRVLGAEGCLVQLRAEGGRALVVAWRWNEGCIWTLRRQGRHDV